MSVISRILLVVSALLLITVFFQPLWTIHLTAPQYPEGIGIQIWIDKVTPPNDLRTLNTLNHYIGMAKIEPAKFIELHRSAGSDISPALAGTQLVPAAADFCCGGTG
jgi:copper chaperone NosL